MGVCTIFLFFPMNFLLVSEASLESTVRWRPRRGDDRCVEHVFREQGLEDSNVEVELHRLECLQCIVYNGCTMEVA